MIMGIKSKSDGDYCAYCDNKVDTSAQDFCHKCGNPLTENGQALRHEQEVSEKLKLLSELASEIKDARSLKVIENKIKNI